MSPSEDDQDEVQALRELGLRIGMPGPVSPADVGVQLESVDSLLARSEAEREDSEADLDLLRARAVALGLPQPHSPQAYGVELESADELLDRFQTANPGSVEPSGSLAWRRGRRRVLRRVLVAGAAVAASALVVVNLPWGTTPASADTPPPLAYQFASATNIAFAPGIDATDDLLRLADAAKNAPSPQRRPGEDVQYVQTDNWFASIEDADTPVTELVPKIRQTWLLPDGSRSIVEVSGRRLNADGRGLARTSDPDGQGSDRVEETYPAGEVDPRRVEELGTDPTRVESELRRAGECEDGPAGALCLYNEVVSLFRLYVVTPDVAAALWTVLAGESQFRSLGSVTDRAGRRGVGISLTATDAPEFRQILIASPKDGQLLGTEEVLIKTNTELDIKAPAIYSFTAILQSGYAKAARELPSDN